MQTLSLFAQTDLPRGKLGRAAARHAPRVAVYAQHPQAPQRVLELNSVGRATCLAFALIPWLALVAMFVFL